MSRAPFLPCAAVLLVMACGRRADVVFEPASVGFASAKSRAFEGPGTSGTEVRLSGPTADVVEVDYVEIDGSARSRNDCADPDYALVGPARTLRFEPGETVATISWTAKDDDVAEGDETFELVLAQPRGAALGPVARQQLTIVDTDRGALLDVTAFGARPDDDGDDTEALQTAVREAAAAGRGVVQVPAGRFIVSRVEVPPGISLVGAGAAVLLRPPGQKTDLHTLDVLRGGPAATPPLLIQGLVIDGARKSQGPFENREQVSSALIALDSDLGQAGQGRLGVVIDGMRLQDCGGDGVLILRDVDVSVCRLDAKDLFRNAITLNGGGSSLFGRDIHAWATVGTTGVAVQPRNVPGAGGSMRTTVDLANLRLDTGDWLLILAGGSTVSIRNLVMGDAPFFINALDSQVRVSDSLLRVGYPNVTANRIEAPSDVAFTNCDFHLSESLRDGWQWDEQGGPVENEANRQLPVADVYWSSTPTASEVQTVTFDQCRFHLSGDVEAADTTYVVRAQPANRAGASVVMRGQTVGPGFDALFAPACSGCVQK